VAKQVANFVVTVLFDAKYKHWNGYESVDDVATPVSTGMLYYLPEHFTGPCTVVDEVDPLIVNLANIHMAYSVPTDPDRQQPEQLMFAREVDNEIKASDSRINNAHVIQISISADVDTQKLIGVPRHRLNHMVNLHRQPFEPLRGYDPYVLNPYSSVNAQVTQHVENYTTIEGKIPHDIGGFMYGNDEHRLPSGLFKPAVDKDVEELHARSLEDLAELKPSQAEVEYDESTNLRGLHINIITRATEWHMTASPIVVHSGYPFHPVNHSIEYGTPVVQLTQHRITNSGHLNPHYISKNSSGQIRLTFEANGGEVAPENIELAIVALLQANVTLNLQATVPMPKSFYDRKGVEQRYGGSKYLNNYFGLVINTELTLSYNPGSVQITDTHARGGNNREDIGAISPLAFLVTSQIDSRSTILDNIPANDEIKLAFPCANAKEGGRPGIRMAHITQDLGYIKELGIVGSGDNRNWETNSKSAATAYGLAQFSCNIALMSGEDSALPIVVDDD
jgi:hypothetical protein